MSTFPTREFTVVDNERMIACRLEQQRRLALNQRLPVVAVVAVHYALSCRCFLQYGERTPVCCTPGDLPKRNRSPQPQLHGLRGTVVEAKRNCRRRTEIPGNGLRFVGESPRRVARFRPLQWLLARVVLAVSLRHAGLSPIKGRPRLTLLHLLLPWPWNGA